ncbi:hypothetical protein GLYMA_07G065900v4 [Glycine max]|uniref:Uncharacterized protein n=1 Tax=Glycine max TaxID=3847 RepID=A0A0R0IZX2_SOYBN|nr:hypothetical protein GYH30_017604 [Glycine max]KRH48061.1 hypothetical protein GLYMA_07G065900v4 [Glycine max]
MDDLVRPRPAPLDRAFRGTTEVTFNIIYIQVLNMAAETNPLHALVAFIFFGLVAFLQIRYPENPTPFQLHPKTTIVSIASFLVYCLAFLGRLKFATTIRVHHFDTIMHVFGSLSLICLVLLLLPNTWESYNMAETSTNKEGGASTVAIHFNGFELTASTNCKTMSLGSTVIL